MKLSTTFAALVGISISAAIAEAQTTPDDESMALIQSLGLKDELPKPGYNMEGGSVFDNYVKARRDGQFFLLGEFNIQFEKPSAEIVQGSFLQWCSNLHFTGSNNNGTYTKGIGYTAHCLLSFIGDAYQHSEAVEAAGAQLTQALSSDEFTASEVLSASYNTHTNMFNMVNHNNNDNAVMLFSDTGLSTMPRIAWETHDEGDLHPNADTSSWSGTGQVTWLSKEEAAALLNNDAADFTPEKFVEIYEKVWNDHHAYAEPTSTGGESTNEEDEEEESTDTDIEEADENDSNTEESMTAAEDTEEEGSESDTEEEDDESSASGGRRLFVAITSMLSTLLGSSV